VLLVTNDAECRRRGLAEGLRCHTVHDYVATACPALRDLLAAAPSADADADADAANQGGGGAAGRRGGGAAYEEHATPAELQAGLRDGRYRQVTVPRCCCWPAAEAAPTAAKRRVRAGPLVCA
jgi:hypothetical protein